MQLSDQTKKPSKLLVVLAFITVYIVWGSTYYFIAKALVGFPPFILGAFRFTFAGLMLLLWCKANGMKIFDSKNIINAGISGVLMLGVGTGSVFWVEQFISSGLVAIIVSSTAIWFVVLDKKLWKQNFNSKFTVAGLIVGFIGVILLFWDQLSNFEVGYDKRTIIGMILLAICPISWAAGSLYAKYHPTEPNSGAVATSWQMIIAGIAFLPVSILTEETQHFDFSNVSANAWWSMAYLITFGSLLAYSAYVWLLKVRPATQVSTYAYVNPVVAVLLGIFLNKEMIGGLQLTGLAIILVSVLLINLDKYKK